MRFVFDRKNVATKTHAASVQLEILYKRQRKYISTGIKLYKGQWNDRKMVVNREDMLALNKSLNEQHQRIFEWVEQLRRNAEVFDFDKLSRFLAQKQTSDSFIEYAESRIEERKDIRDSTRRTQRKLIGSLREFGQIVYFADLNRKNILAYDNWLHEKDYTQTTVHSFHKFLKTYINDAIRAEIIDTNPYDGVKIERGKSKTRKYLTEGEVAKIMSAQLPSNGLERVRDLFLFQCYTGFAYAELMSFDFTKTVERNGKYIVHDTRKKTDEAYYVVLLSPAVAILKRYGFTLPRLTNQQYNLQLKTVASCAGLNKDITSHMGRHTFAVMALNNGIGMESVAKMMGHTDIKTTQLYAKVINSELERAFDKLENAITL